MNRLKALLILLAVAVFAAACGQAATNSAVPSNSLANSQAPATPATATPVAVASGKDLYAKNCMTCHRESGKGGKVTVDGKALDPDDVTTAKMKAKSDEKLYGYISEGFPDDGMPAYKDKLSPDEIKAIIAHVRTLQGS